MAAKTDLPAAHCDRDMIAASLEDPGRFAAVFDRYYDAIWSYLSRRVGPGLAEELASETFLRAFAGRHGYDLGSNVKPGTVHAGATYITAGIVERIGQVPSRSSTP